MEDPAGCRAAGQGDGDRSTAGENTGRGRGAEPATQQGGSDQGRQGLGEEAKSPGASSRCRR